MSNNIRFVTSLNWRISSLDVPKKYMVSCSGRQQQQPQEMAAAAAVWVGGVTAWEKSVRGPMHEQVRGGGAC